MPGAGLLKIASTTHTGVCDCEMMVMRKKCDKDEQQKEDDLMSDVEAQHPGGLQLQHVLC
jgi:hypothetical protein